MVTLAQEYPYLVLDTDRHGNERYYVRKKGQPKIRIQAEYRSIDFKLEYDAAISTIRNPLNNITKSKKASKGPTPATDSFRALVERYYASREFRQLDGATQSQKRYVLDAICRDPISPTNSKTVGEISVTEFSPEVVSKLRDRGRTEEISNNKLKCIRGAFNWAVDQKIVKTNPAKDVARFKRVTEGHHTWTHDEIKMFEEHYPIGTKHRLAFALLYYTGQRRSDVVRLGPPHIREARHMAPQFREKHDGRWLAFRQYKNRNRAPTDLVIPIVPELDIVLQNTPHGEKTFLVAENGRQYLDKSFYHWFKQACERAGLPKHCTPHGLRKALATHYAQKGASTHQLMSWFGWRKTAMAEIYTKAVDQQMLATDLATKAA